VLFSVTTAHCKGQILVYIINVNKYILIMETFGFVVNESEAT